jgi:predicted dehydrogenase
MTSAGLPLRGELIGCGYVSRFHLEAWSRIPEVRLIALCDRDRARLARAHERVPEASAYTEASQLFEREGELDFVEICTQAESHRVLVEQAARRGAHILCQKPAALSRVDFEAMIAACRSAGVRLMIHENWRYRPWYCAMRAEFDQGTIGRPIRLRIAHRDTRALRPDGFALQPYLVTMPRLILMDMGCHLVDTARYLFGEIETVGATTAGFGGGNAGEDVAMLAVTFAGGAVGWLDLSWCAAPDLARPQWALNETVADGSSGTLRLMVDGSLELIDLAGRRERRAVACRRTTRCMSTGTLPRCGTSSRASRAAPTTRRAPRTTSRRWTLSGPPTARQRKDARSPSVSTAHFQSGRDNDSGIYRQAIAANHPWTWGPYGTGGPRYVLERSNMWRYGGTVAIELA